CERRHESPHYHSRVLLREPTGISAAQKESLATNPETMQPPDLSKYSLCGYFLSGYLSQKEDRTNFPSDEFPAQLERYERLFESALAFLGLTKEGLKGKSEFNFDSGDAANLEAGIAMLRVVEALRLSKF